MISYRHLRHAPKSCTRRRRRRASTPSGNAGAGGQGAGALINQAGSAIGHTAKTLGKYFSHPYGNTARKIEQNYGKKALKNIITNAAKSLA